MQYEDLVNEADNAGIVVKDNLQFKSNAAGLIKGNHIGLSAKLSSAEKTCVLAEEICHHDLSVGEIYDIRITKNRKQEYVARMATYDKLINLSGLISIWEHGCLNIIEAADFLNVTPKFLNEAISAYSKKYGKFVHYNNYIIYFEPFGVMKLIGGNDNG